jgi:hypothetical protein
LSRLVDLVVSNLIALVSLVLSDRLIALVGLMALVGVVVSNGLVASVGVTGPIRVIPSASTMVIVKAY